VPVRNPESTGQGELRVASPETLLLAGGYRLSRGNAGVELRIFPWRAWQSFCCLKDGKVGVGQGFDWRAIAA
jgi:hypothetical protein